MSTITKTPLARNTDPITSKQAASKVKPTRARKAVRRGA